MANTNAPSGFRPCGRVDGAAWTSKHTTCKMQNNAGPLNRGDGVSQLADGTVAVAAAAAGHVFRGISEGCHYLSTTMGYPVWSNYWPGAGAAGLVDVYVIDDPNVLFEGMASAGPITLADVGLNADVVVVASTTGFSKWSIGVPGTGAGFPWKIFAVGNMGFNIQDGLDVTAANNTVELAPNDWFLTKGAGI